MENYKLYKELTRPLVKTIKLPIPGIKTEKTILRNGKEILRNIPITNYEEKQLPFKLNKYDIEVSRTDTTITFKRYSSKSYEQVVEDLIRLKYTVSGELAILRQQTTKETEYQEYFNYCEECKAYAKTLIEERKNVIGV